MTGWLTCVLGSGTRGMEGVVVVGASGKEPVCGFRLTPRW